MNNSSYWEDRIANETWKTYNSIEEKNIALLEMYKNAEVNIRKELYDLDAKKELSRSEKYRQNHLNKLQKEITSICESLGDKVEKLTKENMKNASNNVMKNIAEAIDTKFSKLNNKAMEQMINTPWHGSNFSERLWGNTGKLANELNDILTRGITQGKTIAEISFQLSNRMNASMNDAHRLVRTETINTLNRAANESYKKSGIRYARWWAAEDERRCKTCGANHDRVYPIDKAPNLPCHPGCRCTWLPVFEEEITKEDIQHMYDLTDDEMYAINQYVSSESYKINDILRRGTTLNESMKRMSKDLDNALDKLDSYRGDITRSLSIYDSNILQSFLQLHEVGKIVTYPEYLSTTSGDIYNKKGNIQLYILNSKKGKNLTLINKSEKEVLYKRNGSFKVVAREKKKGKVFILLEELD